MTYFMKGCGEKGKIRGVTVQCGISEKIDSYGKCEKIYCKSCNKKFAEDKVSEQK